MFVRPGVGRTFASSAGPSSRPVRRIRRRWPRTSARGALGNQAAFGKTYNVTGEEWMTWNHYHEGVAEALGMPMPRLVHIPSDVLAKVLPRRASISVDIFQYPSIFDNSAAMQDLGFRYTIPWVEGVRRTVAWLDARGKIENCEEDVLEDRVIVAWEQMGEAIQKELTGIDS